MSTLEKESSLSNLASTSQEGLEEVVGLGLNEKLNVTLLSSEWKSSKGGLSTISRELAIQLAKHPGLKVSVYLPQCSEDDKKVASSHNVQLIEAEELTGFDDPIEWLSEVPANHVMDYVIGHGVLLGRYAHIYKRRQQCKLWIQVVHTAPEELGKYKTYADAINRGMKKHEAEVKLCEMADQVVAVGPKLKEAFSRYLCYSNCEKDQPVSNLTPSIFSEFSHVKQSPEERKMFDVLVLGRGDSEDFHLKGYDIVAKAIAQLGLPFCLMFVGSPSGKEDEITKHLLDLGISHNQLTVRCFNESREQLAKLFCEVDLATMPSRTEGFGLVALEALSASLPVLVSGNSGLGEALKNVPYGSQWVVDSENPEDWANVIRTVREKDRDLRLEETKLLSEKYAEKFSWGKQCKSIVEKLQKITVETAAQDSSVQSRCTPQGNLQANKSVANSRSLDEGTAAQERDSPSVEGRCTSQGNIRSNQGVANSRSLDEGSAEKRASKKSQRSLCNSGGPAPKKSRLARHGYEDYIGYVQHVGDIQESRSSNLYFDLQLQVSVEEAKQIRVMQQRNDDSKRQIFVDKKAAQQPIKLTNLTVSPSGTIFFNEGASIQDVANHVIKFQFVPQQPCQVTKISSVLKSTSGIFNVCGTVKWKEEAHIPSDKTDKMVRDGTLTDSSGSIPISIWGECITFIAESTFYNITNCKLRRFYGKCLTTTLTSKISPAEEQNISEIVEQKHETPFAAQRY